VLDRLLTARTLVPLALLWAAALLVAAVQGQGESGGGVRGFVSDLPWHTFLVLSLVFVLIGVVALVRRVGRRSDSAAA
jgi:hypothetical protein